MNIRPATDLDATAVAELLNAAYALIGIDLGETPETVTERSRNSMIIVTEMLGSIVATMTLAGPGSPAGQMADTGQLQASRIAVNPAFQGRGLASQMLRTVAALCREHGIDAVVGASLDSMPTAHRLYESMGAKPDTIPEMKARTYKLELTERTAEE